MRYAIRMGHSVFGRVDQTDSSNLADRVAVSKEAVKRVRYPVGEGVGGN